MANGQGSFDLNVSSDDEPTLWGDAARIVVCKYDPDKSYPGCYSVIPNIQCDAITSREGLEPPVAKFHYVLDDTAESNQWPTQYEEIFAILEAKGQGNSRDAAKRTAYVIQPDDRIAVLCYQDAKSREDFSLLFDGFAEAPEVGVSGNSQAVTFEASDVSVRLRDEPIIYRIERDANSPTTPGDATRKRVEAAIIFNPKGKGNCTPITTAFMEDATGNPYPIFVDTLQWDAPVRSADRWKLSELACYLMGWYNDENFVDNPDFSIVRKLLVNRQPKDGAQFFNPDDSTTYVEEPIDIVEYDATGKRWPDVLAEQLGFAGFGSKLICEKGSDNKPTHRIEIYRKDGTGIGVPLEINHQDAYEDLDPVNTNTGELSVKRDYKGAFNAVAINTKPELWEVSVVLAPAFQPSVGDETGSNRDAYQKTVLGDASGDTRKKYRWYVADEAGEGHWNQGTTSWVPLPFDFSDIWPDVDGERSYCIRRRPGKGTLNSVDSAGVPIKARLDFSRDYIGAQPDLWNGTGNWQQIIGGWELLDDRLGIRVTVNDPEEWSIGEYKGPDRQETGKRLAGITSIANPTSANPYFYLRLTCVIEADLRPVGVIEPRKSSALKYERTIFSSAKEHFAVKYVARRSAYNSSDDHDTLFQDDSDKIRDFATQVQQAHENPAIAGRVVIPWIDQGYPIGEVISKVKGRDLSLLLNGGIEQGEARRYPTNVGITYELTGRQATIIQLSDHRADPR